MEGRSRKMEADAHPEPVAICMMKLNEKKCMMGMFHYVYCRL